MTLDDYLSALRRYWAVLVLCCILGTAGAYGYSKTLPRTYASETQVMIITARGDNTAELMQGANYVESVVQTYTVLAKSPTVLDPVITKLGLGSTARQLARQVEVSVPLNTVVLDIRVTDEQPKTAQEIAGALASELQAAVASHSPKASDGTPAVRVATIEPAQMPTVPAGPNTRNNTMLGLLAGLFVGVVYALLRRRFANRVQSGEELQDMVSVPLLGEVASASDGRAAIDSLVQSPHVRISETMRQVTAAFTFLTNNAQHRVILVTSAQSSEGKSVCSLGLARTLAEVGHKVLFVEADLRRASTYVYTGLEPSVGLTSVVMGEVDLESALQDWGHPRLSVLVSGRLPPNPGLLLSSEQMHHLIDEVRSQYDYVIVDSAPVLPVSDTLWVGPFVDGCVVVARANRTRRKDLLEAFNRLNRNGVPLLGMILNDVRLTNSSPYYVKDVDRRRRWRFWSRVAAPARHGSGPLPMKAPDESDRLRASVRQTQK